MVSQSSFDSSNGSSKKNLLIFGASGHGKVIADAAMEAGWHVLGFSDDDPNKRGSIVGVWPVIAVGVDEAVKTCREQSAHMIVGIGNNRIRRDKFLALKQAGASFATIVHPRSIISSSVMLGEGVLVLAGAVINPFSRIGDNAVINTSVSVDHDSVIENHVQLTPGVCMGGEVVVEEGAYVGVGASVRNQIRIGAWSLVGVGSVVVTHVGANTVVYGNPARFIRSQ